MGSMIFTTAGSSLSIGPAKASDGEDFVAADFAGIADNSWKPIGGLTNLSRLGDGAELVTSNHITTRRARKAKGTRNSGAMSVVADLDLGDAGQLALIAAEKSDDTFAFKFRSKTGDERFFVALVMNVEQAYNEANSTMALNATLEIDGNVADGN